MRRSVTPVRCGSRTNAGAALRASTKRWYDAFRRLRLTGGRRGAGRPDGVRAEPGKAYSVGNVLSEPTHFPIAFEEQLHYAIRWPAGLLIEADLAFP